MASRALSRVSDAVIGLSTDGRIRYLNNAAERMLGVDDNSSIDTSLEELLKLDSSSPQDCPIEQCLETGETGSRTLTVSPMLKPGVTLDVRVTVTPTNSTDQDQSGAVVVLSDTSELRRMNARLTYEARHDSLTTLFNRRELISRVERLLALRRSFNAQHALLYLDLDRFKFVNDSGGHSAGDQLLIEISKSLKALVRENDTVARIGGDEFVILLEHCSLRRAEDVANSVLCAVRNLRFEYDGRNFRVGVSIGLVPIYRNYTSFDEILSDADRACYRAKREGRNRVVVHHDGGCPSPVSATTSEDLDVQKILEEQSFVVAMQNIVSTARPERVVGYEALLRIKDQDGRLWRPARFLAEARRLEMTVDLDRCVVNHILAQYNPRDDVLRRPTEFVAINVSPSSIQDQAFVESLIAQIEHTRFPPDLLCFELTEYVGVDDVTGLDAGMRRLAAIGCLFAVDDFGAGQHRFDYIRELPIDIVKIDGTIARRMCTSLVDRTIVKSINEISHLLGKRTVIEHVENEVIHAEAEALGIDFCQGRLLGDECVVSSLRAG